MGTEGTAATLRLLEELERQLPKSGRVTQAWDLAQAAARQGPPDLGRQFLEAILERHLARSCEAYRKVEFILIGSLLRQAAWQSRAAFMRAQYAPWPFVMARLYIAAHAPSADIAATMQLLQENPNFSWEDLVEACHDKSCVSHLVQLHNAAMEQLIMHNPHAVLRISEFWAECFVRALAEDAEVVSGQVIEQPLRQQFEALLLSEVCQAPAGTARYFTGKSIPENLPSSLREAFGPAFVDDSPWDFHASLPAALDPALLSML